MTRNKIIGLVLGLLVIGGMSYKIFYSDLSDTEKVEAQIYQYPTKGTPEFSDLLVMSDESDSHAVKTATMGTLPVSTPTGDALDLKQDSNANLDDLADGSLTGSKVGTGINGDYITTGTVSEPRIDSSIARVSQLGGGFLEIISSEMDDTSSPYITIDTELQNTILNNYQSSGIDTEYILRPAAAGFSFIAIIGSGYEMLISPSPSESLYFNGVALSVDEGVNNASLVLGQRIVFYTIRLNGAYRWMCYSADAGWVEETP